MQFQGILYGHKRLRFLGYLLLERLLAATARKSFGPQQQKGLKRKWIGNWWSEWVGFVGRDESEER
jgi:hypothetical protein